MKNKGDRPWLNPVIFETNDDGEVKSNYIMSSRGLKLIGIRFYPYDGTNGYDERKAKCIQKSLYGKTNWFYFNKGFKIFEGENGSVSKVTVSEDAFDSNKYLYSREDKCLNVSVSAIVGQNGTGKSTIVDTVIRLLNNLSAAIIGEDFVCSSAQHLHFIENVYASLAVYRDTNILILTCKANNTSNTIKGVLEPCVINSGTVVCTTQQNIGGRYTKVSEYLDIDNIEVIGKVPPVVVPHYRVTEIKAEFGDNSKIVENRNVLFLEPRFLKACEAACRKNRRCDGSLFNKQKNPPISRISGYSETWLRASYAEA